MGNFYSRLSYSFGNEDWKTEKKALQIQPKDRVICVTASGDRPLNLLANPLTELITLDANPVQNALFDLKKTALDQLSYPEYLAFLGVDAHANRRDLFHQKIESALSPLSTLLLKQHLKKIEKGILYQGALEIWIKRISQFIQLISGKKVNQLFSFDDHQEQCAFIDKEWNQDAWRNTFRMVIRPFFVKLIIKDPGLYAYVDPSINVGSHLYDRIHGFLQRNLAKDSVLLSLLFQGKVERSSLPYYLTEEGHRTIKSQLHRANYATADLISFLEQAPEKSFDCFSMSDVASYVGQDQFNRMIKAIFKSARPKARFCIRQFLSNHQIPEAVAPYFKRESALEKQLEHEDCCCVYKFIVGTIEK